MSLKENLRTSFRGVGDTYNKFRMFVVEQIAEVGRVSGDRSINWQSMIVPTQYTRDMINLIPDIKTLNKILVLFSLEFVIELVDTYGVEPNKIYFIGNSEEGCNFIRFLGVHAHHMPKQSCLTEGQVDMEKVLEHIKQCSEA
jgi:hypothetical protein